MEKHNKIHWKKGLDITPEILIASDNYHIAERNLLGRFFAFRLYGILPGRKFYIEKDIDNNNVYIKNLECFAITNDGYIINIQRDTPFSKELSLKEAMGAELYVILTVDPYAITPEYNLALKRVGETIENGIPVLKIYKNNQCWEIDNNYIPPSIALYSVDTLKQQYSGIKNRLSHITEKLPENDMICIQAMLLKLELDNYCLQESPQELVSLLKKICWTLKLHLKTSKRMNELPDAEKFIEEQYNHNDIEKTLRLGVDSLAEIDRKIDEKPIEPEPVVEKEEEPEEIEIKV